MNIKNRTNDFLLNLLYYLSRYHVTLNCDDDYSKHWDNNIKLVKDELLNRLEK